jgi:hypothetical protein
MGTMAGATLLSINMDNFIKIIHDVSILLIRHFLQNPFCKYWNAAEKKQFETL